MNILIKKAKIIDPNSKHNNKIRDILIINGKIEKIASRIKKPISSKKITEIIEKNLHLSPGWFDMHVNFGEPGFEQRETIKTGSESAIKGGFTGVQIMPNTEPVLDNRGQIDSIFNKVRNNIIDIVPAGNITKKQQGEEITEMRDMFNGGCKAFTDDKKSLMRNDILTIAMLYTKDIDAVIMNFPNENYLAKDGKMHEGQISTELGIKGIPKIAEEIMIDRDLQISNYTKSRIHLSYISTSNGVQKIKQAKQQGLKVTADVALHNLFLTDKSVNNFDTRYKVLPPLRERSDINMLLKSVKNGIIDVITSDHTPINKEEKKIEFENAAFGIIGLETAFGLIGKHLTPYLTIEEIIKVISINPREILKLKKVVIDEKNNANLTLFNPELEWIFTKDDIRSKSKNSPFIGQTLKGKAIAIYNNGKFRRCK
ncbi:MAG: dihydroorotase [Bacteroidota bacterium]|nr:dihydroorotase [Bacteroidota bacterium]